MKKYAKLLSLLLLVCLCIAALVACDPAEPYDCNKDGHQWNDNVCTQCNKKKCEVSGEHAWENGVCKYCGTAQPADPGNQPGDNPGSGDQPSTPGDNPGSGDDPCANGHTYSKITGKCVICGASRPVEDPCANGHNYGSDGKCTGCGKTECEVTGTHAWVNAVCTKCGEEYELIDYVSQLKLDMSSKSAKYTDKKILKQFVDGDTTHFYVPTSICEDGVLKARYLGVNTPESTGKIEPYGKIASNFTHETLQNALDNGGSILLESDTDDGVWNHDSYGRMLVWVWYKPSANAEYRNLNLELLQRGYAWGSNSGDNRYGEMCVAALNQAVQAKLVVQSGLKDETFYYGDAIEIDLKQLRTHLEDYENKKVAFEGTVTLLYNGGSYVEQYDNETGIAYGIYIYYGTEKSAKVKEMLGTIGNVLRVVGTLSNYNGSWQVSGVQYRIDRPKDPANLQLISKDGEASYQKFTVPEFFGNKTVMVYDEETEEQVEKTYKMCELVLNTTVSFDNLYVYRCYTTQNGGNSDGAITLYCRDANGNEITVRTDILYKVVDGETVRVLEGEFKNKTISVRGIVDYYSDQDIYQVKVLLYSDIVVEE